MSAVTMIIKRILVSPRLYSLNATPKLNVRRSTSRIQDINIDAVSKPRKAGQIHSLVTTSMLINPI